MRGRPETNRRLWRASRSISFTCLSLCSGVPAGPQCHHPQSAAGTGAVENQHAQMGSPGPTQNHHLIASSSHNWDTARGEFLPLSKRLESLGKRNHCTAVCSWCIQNFSHTVYFSITNVWRYIQANFNFPNTSTVVFKRHKCSTSLWSNHFVSLACEGRNCHSLS